MSIVDPFPYWPSRAARQCTCERCPCCGGIVTNPWGEWYGPTWLGGTMTTTTTSAADTSQLFGCKADGSDEETP